MKPSLFIFLSSLLITLSTASAQPPTTQTAVTRPATQVDLEQSIHQMFLRLSDPDPSSRLQAKMDLMGLGAGDLPTLRNIAGTHLPLPPEIVSALHEIVLQIFLASQKYVDLNGNDCDAYSANAPCYFLGIRWPLDMDENQRLGTSIDERLPGFPGFRYLRRGDMILTITFDTSLPVIETHTRKTLIDTIQEHPQRQNMILQIMRSGQEFTIPIKMSPRPLEAGPPDPPPNMDYSKSMQAFNQNRIHSAEDYWHLHFDDICGEHSQTAASNPLE